MENQNNKLDLLGSAPVSKALRALGLPIMVGMLINALYNLADAYFVGGLGQSPMGAISVAFPLGQTVVGLGLMFGNGAASCLSRLLGRGDTRTAGQAASTALYSGLLLGAGVILVGMVFLEPLLRLLGATETILPYALAYARIYLPSCFFNLFNVTMNNIVSSEGASRTAMWALLLGAGLNLILDPLFIYGLHWGVAGAAAATALSQMVSALVYLGYILRGKSAFTFRPSAFTPSPRMLGEILKIGVPTLSFQLLTSLSIALTNRAASSYGDPVIAGMGAVTRITSMGTLVVFGFLKGFQPVAGFSYGARNFARLRAAVSTALRWSTLFCLVSGLGTALFPVPSYAASPRAMRRCWRRDNAPWRPTGSPLSYLDSTLWSPPCCWPWAGVGQASFWGPAARGSASCRSSCCCPGSGAWKGSCTPSPLQTCSRLRLPLRWPDGFAVSCGRRRACFWV